VVQATLKAQTHNIPWGKLPFRLHISKNGTTLYKQIKDVLGILSNKGGLR